MLGCDSYGVDAEDSGSLRFCTLGSVHIRMFEAFSVSVLAKYFALSIGKKKYFALGLEAL